MTSKERKEAIYSHLEKTIKEKPYKCNRYNMVSYCIGYYKKVNNTIWNCINELYENGLIEE